MTALRGVLAASLALFLNHNDVSVNAKTDIPGQLKNFNNIAAPAIPNTLPNTLETLLNGANFSTLDASLQRALLWNLGLVRVNDDTTDTYVQVYVLCGRTMNDVFLSSDAFDNDMCPLQECKSGVISFAQSSCDSQVVAEQTLCAIVNTDLSLNTATGPIWSLDGSIDSSFDVQMYQYEATNSSDDPVYMITEKSTWQQADGNCGNKPTFIVPCRTVKASAVDESNQERKWCKPENQLGVTLWLADAVGSSSTGSGTDSESSSGTAEVVLGICVGILALICIVLAVLLFKSRRQDKSAATSSSRNDIANRYQQSATPEMSSDQRSSGQNFSSGQNSAKIEAINESYRQRSTIIAQFCEDQELLIKRLTYSAIRFHKQLASGANGEVWLGEYEHQSVAIKRAISEKQDGLDIRVLELFMQEIRLASALEHPNIVRFIGLSWRTLPELCMVSEFMPVGDLSHFLNSTNGKRLTWKGEKVELAADISNALVYLHSLMPMIIHRDLKSLNVLLNENLHAKLSDFGLSRERSLEETMTSGVGTFLWTAPEVLRGEKYSEKADIYSFGVVLSELDTCLPPYSLNKEIAETKSKSMTLMPLITRGQITPQFRPDCPPAILDLAKACLDQNPNNRPPAMQIIYLLRSKIAPTL